MTLDECLKEYTGIYHLGISEDRKQKLDSYTINQDVSILYEYLFKPKLTSSDYAVIVQCNKCKEYCIRYVSCMVKGSDIRCEGCFTRKYKDILEANNYTYRYRKLSGTGGVNVHVTCNTCNTESFIGGGNLINQRKIECKVCRRNSVIAKLKEYNCEFLYEIADKRNNRVFYKTPSGIVLSNIYFNILNRSFNKNGASHWDQKHNLYLVKLSYNDKVFYKIGTANDPTLRIKTLKLSGSYVVNVLDSFENRRSATKQEHLLHKLFEEYSINKTAASEFTNGVGKNKLKMGITEWFSSEIFETLCTMYPILKDN